MREKTLLKISLVSGLAGLILLFALLETTPPHQESLGKIHTENIRGEVLIHGKITRMSNGNETQFLQIVSEDPFSITIFRDEAIPLNIGNLVEIRGTMEEFNGKKQFIGEEIRRID